MAVQAWPLDAQQIAQVRTVVDGLSANQLYWLSGYLAGIAEGRGEPRTDTAQATSLPITVLYLSHTGNGRGIAKRLCAQAEAAGIPVRLVNVTDYATRSLRDEKLLLLVASTYGDGEPHDDAKPFYDFLHSRKAPRLEGLRYSVLALGDSSYPKFCQTGRDFDKQLADLGAERLLPMVTCDLDFDEKANGWIVEALGAMRSVSAVQSSGGKPRHLWPVPSVPTATRENPLAALVVANQRITGRLSRKDVRHIEFAFGESAVRYEPGDSLGIWPKNPTMLVSQVLSLTNLDGESVARRAQEQYPLRSWLSERLEITQLSQAFVRAYAEVTRSAALAALLEPTAAEELRDFVATRQVVDVLRDYPAQLSPDNLVHCLRRLTPRAYSIASSQRACPDEVHITVRVVDYSAFGHRHVGAASFYMASEMAVGDSLQVYVEANERFRLPSDSSAPIIMIGAGTGVAPYRAFMQERAETGAKGKNWLVFGEQNRRSTFLYQKEWLDWRKNEFIQRIDVAFSRDQETRIYVQDKIRAAGRELVGWLDDGAVVYVCGDAKRMAPAVHEALLSVLQSHKAMTVDRAAEYLAELSRVRRYNRDVY